MLFKIFSRGAYQVLTLDSSFHESTWVIIFTIVFNFHNQTQINVEKHKFPYCKLSNLQFKGQPNRPLLNCKVNMCLHTWKGFRLFWLGWQIQTCFWSSGSRMDSSWYRKLDTTKEHWWTPKKTNTTNQFIIISTSN